MKSEIREAFEARQHVLVISQMLRDNKLREIVEMAQSLSTLGRTLQDHISLDTSNLFKVVGQEMDKIRGLAKSEMTRLDASADDFLGVAQLWKFAMLKSTMVQADAGGSSIWNEAVGLENQVQMLSSDGAQAVEMLLQEIHLLCSEQFLSADARSKVANLLIKAHMIAQHSESKKTSKHDLKIPVGQHLEEVCQELNNIATGPRSSYVRSVASRVRYDFRPKKVA
mmetsp:Transcript_8002/g.12704  ORF Transcript_8002/g.12704 Transcript_8002/m.12704 type:complete len:225 (-) Transcript_8002:45-719(-)